MRARIQIKATGGDSLRAQLQEAARFCAERLVYQMMGDTVSAAVKSR